jgi:glutamine synthetase
MNRIPLIMVVSTDFAGQVRGKGFPASELDARMEKGVGWTYTNTMINCFGTIPATPWGPRGDLNVVPDPETLVDVDFGDGSVSERFFLGDILEMDRSPWDCCLRNYLRTALAELKDLTGLTMIAAFEHEFYHAGQRDRLGDSYSQDGVRRIGEFPEALLYALAEAGVEPETFLPEYGPKQFEFTVKPAEALKAADRAVIVREITRGTAWRQGDTVSFSPVVTRGAAGNGVHIHMSFRDAKGRPVTYDPGKTGDLSDTAGSFIAGILEALPALCAVTAPSYMSYERLKPNSWSSSLTNLGYRDREAAIRICPVSDVPGADVADSFNFEFRAGDAAASPYLQLGILVRAGIDGIRRKLATPTPTTGDPWQEDAATRHREGIAELPTSLEDALALLEAHPKAGEFLPGRMLEAYLMHKRGELTMIEGRDVDEICRMYAEAY